MSGLWAPFAAVSILVSAALPSGVGTVIDLRLCLRATSPLSPPSGFSCPAFRRGNRHFGFGCLCGYAFGQPVCCLCLAAALPSGMGTVISASAVFVRYCLRATQSAVSAWRSQLPYLRVWEVFSRQIGCLGASSADDVVVHLTWQTILLETVFILAQHVYRVQVKKGHMPIW